MVLDMLPFWRHRVVLTWPVFPFSSLSSPLSLTQELGGACKVSSHTLCYKNNPGFIGIAMGGWHVGRGGWGLRVKWLYSTIHLSY